MSDEWCTNYNSWSDDLYEWNKILTIHQTPRGDRERHGTDSSIMLAQLICAKFGSSISHEYIQWHGKHTVGARQGQCNDTPASATMVNGAGNGSTVPETHQISVASETENLLLTLLRNLKVRWPTRQQGNIYTVLSTMRLLLQTNTGVLERESVRMDWCRTFLKCHKQ